MEIKEAIKINEFRVKINLPPKTRVDGIKAFVELTFVKENGDTFAKVKGIRIEDKIFNNNSVLSIEFPAFRAGSRFYKSFFLEDRDLYGNVAKEIINKYKKETQGYSGDDDAFEDMPF